MLTTGSAGVDAGLLWLAIAKAVADVPDTEAVWCSQDAWCTGAHTHVGGIKQLRSFQHHWEWRDV